ncbi:MAG: hypothetical protein ACOC44_20455 [Promethearchaeia archaeon]
MGKKFWKSKTLWTNFFIVVGGISTYISGQLEAGATITAVGVINTALRIITKEELLK